MVDDDIDDAGGGGSRLDGTQLVPNAMVDAMASPAKPLQTKIKPVAIAIPCRQLPTRLVVLLQNRRRVPILASVDPSRQTRNAASNNQNFLFFIRFIIHGCLYFVFMRTSFCVIVDMHVNVRFLHDVRPRIMDRNITQ
mmetsp:Transcript_12320/g.22357  ORF Transcript_12320/g.22357 Transcript_12320/m.22357 type:complete len:138 (-) Transcript_12320:200-613(-)